MGSFSASPGSTECDLCGAGYYSESPTGAAACTPCVLGTYNEEEGANSSSMCEACPAGTYAINPAATSNATCIACSPGQFSTRLAATTFSTCRQCPIGTYAADWGTSRCTECPVGTASAIVGSSSVDDCQRCDPGWFANATGMSACEACPLGSFQAAYGQTGCNECPAGSFSNVSAATACFICSPSLFSNASGFVECVLCPSGTLQLQPGGTSCDACPISYTDLPMAIEGTVATSVVVPVTVCESLARSVVLNWGPVENPLLLAASVLVTSALPEWLSVEIIEAKIVVLQSSLVPSAVALDGELNVTLSVMQTCRASPWTGTIVLAFERVDPGFERTDGSASTSLVEACPDFSLQYSALLGTCAALTVVRVTLLDGSPLPAFMTYAYGNGVVEIVGTAPSGMAPVAVVAVAQLGRETFYSDIANITLLPTSIPELSAAVTSVRACPYFQLQFTIVRSSSCGRLQIAATLSNGSALPSFLHSATSALGPTSSSLNVFGTVPEGYGDIEVTAVATAGTKSYNSSAVVVLRPALDAPVNVSLETSGGSEVATSVSQSAWVASGIRREVTLVAMYGATARLHATIEPSATDRCGSITLVASSSPPINSSTSGNVGSISVGGSAPALTLPAWFALTLTAATVLVASGSPPKDVPEGYTLSLYLWANDGLYNPGFNVTIVVRTSLLLLTATSSNNSSNSTSLSIYRAEESSILPKVVSPSPLISLSLHLISLDSRDVPLFWFICPTTVFAFCSYDSAKGFLSALGAADGISSVLAGVQIAHFKFLPTLPHAVQRLIFKSEEESSGGQRRAQYALRQGPSPLQSSP